MRLIILFYLALIPLNLFGQSKYICITVDDLPAVTYGEQSPQLSREITDKLVRTFKTYGIPAIGYVNESQLYQNDKIDSAKVELLITWLRNGNELGNHTFSHLDFNNVTDSVYFNDILKGEIVTRKLMEQYGKKLKYFRHPYLHTGMNEQRSRTLKKYLTSLHYVTAPITIDNDDYLYAQAYHQAYIKGNDSLMKKIGKSYVDYMEKKLVIFEQKSQEVFGRNIAQTLLIHASLINADYLDDLASVYIKHGYQFVSQTKVLKDNAYKSPDSYYTKRGISWIYRWGISKGMSEELMNEDVEVKIGE